MKQLMKFVAILFFAATIIQPAAAQQGQGRGFGHGMSRGAGGPGRGQGGPGHGQGGADHAHDDRHDDDHKVFQFQLTNHKKNPPHCQGPAEWC